MIRPIMIWPNDSLRAKAAPIDNWEIVQSLYLDLRDTMLAFNGVGIAAPQIGVSLSMFLLLDERREIPDLIETTDDPKVSALINPVITELSTEEDVAEEGCLSFPNIYLPIKRPTWCVIEARNLNGEAFSWRAEGFLARATQHEYDHLNGKLFSDFFSELKRRSIKQRLNKWRKKYAPG